MNLISYIINRPLSLIGLEMDTSIREEEVIAIAMDKELRELILGRPTTQLAKLEFELHHNHKLIMPPPFEYNPQLYAEKD